MAMTKPPAFWKPSVTLLAVTATLLESVIWSAESMEAIVVPLGMPGPNTDSPTTNAAVLSVRLAVAVAPVPPPPEILTIGAEV